MATVYVMVKVYVVVVVSMIVAFTTAVVTSETSTLRALYGVGV